MKCSDCKYVIKERPDAHALTHILICKRFPPNATTLPGPNGAIARLSASPIVQPGDYCYEFAPMPADA